jgi:NADPH-dependent 2,4-dienoyl-CoA reductase/sulfur reductase-like enzyme/nitrite reductase/ring-hydroxylating ferredoxin subunit
MGGESTLSGPDLSVGIPVSELQDGVPLLGHANGSSVILVRTGSRFYALGATCSHWGGPLAEGLVRDGAIQCPWHHACFALESGAQLAAPALNPVSAYEVVIAGDRVRVGDVKEPARRDRRPLVKPASVVIVGAGAAGASAAEWLRKEGYGDSITLIGEDPADPVDRPNLSKDYLAGRAQAEWIPLRDAGFYRDHQIDLIRGVKVTGLDPAGKDVRLSDGRSIPYGAVLLATGAEPIRLPIPGSDLPHVHTLRSLANSDALIASVAAESAVVVIGASFIGLEVAAALRSRDKEVTVVAPEPVPLGAVLGPEVGAYVRRIHEAHGVRFRLGRKPVAIESSRVTLDDGTTLDARVVVMGVGVRPRTALAEASGIAVDRGILVNEYFRTSAPDVFAAGDVARYPYFDQKVRIEHWVVAERQGQAVAAAMVGRGHPFRDVPFFWSTHYDATISYLGHAERWDSIEIKGSLDGGSAFVVYRGDGLIQAVAGLNRDHALLEAEQAMVDRDAEALATLVERQ